ncbi:hypothetical protein D3C73_21410 [compost metagenome]
MKGNSNMVQMTHSRDQERGAVSIFIVVFCALLMTVLTISFIRLMIQEQQQAATNDLSQSAYDSAQAGLEDAKRALLLCQSGNSGACDALDSNACSSVPAALSSSTSTDSETGNTEIKIQTGTGDEKLDQAYTCVKVDRTPSVYPGSLNPGASEMIPLKTGGKSFDRIELRWFEYGDLRNAGLTSHDIDLEPASSLNAQLPPTSNGAWPKNRPSLMRAQLMQFGAGGFTLDGLNAAAADESNANTVFLYPTRAPAASSIRFIDDERRAQDGDRLNVVECEKDLNAEAYACTITIELPEPIAGDASNRTAYLRLGALYNTTAYSLRLLQGTTEVPFDGVIATVDSTGRANDLFRRVESTVKLEPIDFPYPEAALDLTGSLCKNFVITDGTGTNQGYRPSASCTP